MNQTPSELRQLVNTVDYLWDRERDCLRVGTSAGKVRYLELRQDILRRKERPHDPVIREKACIAAIKAHDLRHLHVLLEGVDLTESPKSTGNILQRAFRSTVNLYRLPTGFRLMYVAEKNEEEVIWKYLVQIGDQQGLFADDDELDS